MPRVALVHEHPAQSPALRADTLADSVLILLVLLVVQRAVGFCRAVLLCRWLDADQLGQWDMALGFLMLAGPVVVLSLPATFGRYVEHYRRQGQLRLFLQRNMLACGGLAAAAVAGLVLARAWFAALIFGSADHGPLVALVAVSLLAIVAFNFLTELFTALRNVRLVAALQLLNSAAFAGIALALVLGWKATAASVVVAYGAACLVSVLVAGRRLTCAWSSLPDEGLPLPHRALWARMIPFAFWIWCVNVLANLVDLVDRYMILHYLPVDHEAALATVGQYHSSRVMPTLLFSLAALLGAMATPHFSSDWEAGRRDLVSARLNLFLKLLSPALVAAAVLILGIAPLLFGVAFQGKFAQGEAVLPWTLAYCIWFGLAVVAQNYLWCAEKARWGSLAFLVGLVTNVVLNLLLLPRLGLLGAVLATSAANALVLALVCLFDCRAGFRMQRGTWLLLALPAAIPLGPAAAASVLAVVAMSCLVSDWLLSREEKQMLWATCRQYLARVRAWPIAARPIEADTP